jgi:hypothetical protein
MDVFEIEATGHVAAAAKCQRVISGKADPLR